MFQRILTQAEVDKINQYLKDGKRDHYVQVLTTFTRKFTPRIVQDLQLMKALLTKYDQEKTKSKKCHPNPFRPGGKENET